MAAALNVPTLRLECGYSVLSVTVSKHWLKHPREGLVWGKGRYGGVSHGSTIVRGSLEKLDIMEAEGNGV